MQILYKKIQILGANHSKNFAKILDRQEEPELYKAVMGKIDNTINALCGVGPNKINPEMEMVQDMMFQGLGLGSLDTLIDIVKYGKFALSAIRYKLFPYLLEYRNSLVSNLPPLHPVKMFIKEDFRKGEITSDEVNSKIRQIFFSG